MGLEGIFNTAMITFYFKSVLEFQWWKPHRFTLCSLVKQPCQMYRSHCKAGYLNSVPAKWRKLKTQDKKPWSEHSDSPKQRTHKEDVHTYLRTYTHNRQFTGRCRRTYRDTWHTKTSLLVHSFHSGSDNVLTYYSCSSTSANEDAMRAEPSEFSWCSSSTPSHHFFAQVWHVSASGIIHYWV